MTILTVDDATTLRKLVSYTLRSQFNVIEATNASEALQVLATKQVHLMITDVNMPGISGIELIQKARQGGYKMPMLVLTTESDTTVKQKARVAGATGWIVKPFQQQQLLSIVAKVLNVTL